MNIMSDFCKTCKHNKNKGIECEVCIHMESETPSNYAEFDPEKHVKGYIYDSLVYRYKFALEQATEARAMTLTHHSNKQEAIAAARKLNERDMLRFCQILDEAIGEHY